MGQKDQILLLARARRTTSPGEVAAWADAEDLAQALDGEVLFRHIDELEPHRLPSLAKKRWPSSGSPAPGAGSRSRVAAASVRLPCLPDGPRADARSAALGGDRSSGAGWTGRSRDPGRS